MSDVQSPALRGGLREG